MSKKMKVLIAVLVAVITLSVSGVVAALAHGEDEEIELGEEELFEELNEVMPGIGMFAYTGSSELLSRVAEILDISEDELSDAFVQARQEIMGEHCDEAFHERLEQAVEDGLITEEEAEEIQEWWEQRPEALDWTQLGNAFWMHSHHGYPADNGWECFEGGRLNIRLGSQELSNPGLGLEILEEAIEEGLISEEDADRIRAWADNKPTTLNQLSPKPRISSVIRGRHMMGGWHGPLPYQERD
jgi:hypothetical protein